MGASTKFEPRTLERILMLVRAGNYLSAAAGDAGVTKKNLYDWRKKAKAGVAEYVEFFEKVELAEASSEARDVFATAKAANIEPVRVSCPSCRGQVELSADQALALTEEASALAAAQRMRTEAAQMALQRLQLRFPKRWSPRMIHEIGDAHERFLDVAQRVLAPEVFELLLAEFVASEGGEPPVEDPGEQAQELH